MQRLNSEFYQELRKMKPQARGERIKEVALEQFAWRNRLDRLYSRVAVAGFTIFAISAIVSAALSLARADPNSVFLSICSIFLGFTIGAGAFLCKAGLECESEGLLMLRRFDMEAVTLAKIEHQLAEEGQRVL